ncbi:MAG: DNA internalization-related competence protein ComEC/Rec2 [Bacteroidota bacterium]|nr:DNA internalization-related competence protein ComEC/Rec2 [Bacteroidota bacterium]
MKNRPALIGATAIVSGILTARFLIVDWKIFFALTILLLVFSVIEFYVKRKIKGRDIFRSFAILALLFFSSAALYSINDQLRNTRHITHYLDSTDSLTIYCKVIDEPRVDEGKTKLLVSLISLNNEFDSIEVEGKAYISILANKKKKETPKEILYGSFISLKGILQSPSDERNPGEFSHRQYLELNNIYATASVYGYSDIVVSEYRDGNFFFESIIFPSKNFIVKTIRTVMKGDEANFLIGLLLGDRTDISQEIKSAFMNTGTIHVLAVSGSHVVLVAEIIFVIVGLLRFSKKPKIIIAILVLFYYMFLTGATPSVVRATLMIMVFYIGKLFEERTDVYNVLCVSAIIILLIEPKQLFDVGFQLSFSAVFSIVYFYPKLNALIPKIPEPLEEFKILKWVWQLFAVSLAAQIGTLPFTAFYFGKVSIVSLFANLIVVPLVGLIVTIGLSGALFGIVSLWIASCFSEMNDLLAIFTLNFVRWAEQVPFAIINTATFGLRETILYSAFIGFLFNIGNRAFQKRIIFASLIIGNIILFNSFFQPTKNNLRITFLDVGQGDGAVIQFPTGEVIVVDAGPKTNEFDAGEKTVAPFLRRNGIATIDAIITTHPHADHLGGVPYLLKNFSIKHIIDPDQSAQSNLFYQYDLLRKNGIHLSGRAGMMIPIGNARLYILHPTKQFIDTDSANGYSDLNESSIVFKLQYGNTSFLFTGDAETEAEEHLVNSYHDFLDSDVLKAGHHGSSTSSSEYFISAVKPQKVVVSVAKFNKFRHPSKRVIERFKLFDASVFRTDSEGAIILESDGKTVNKLKWRN